jgi:hypothetical protein
MTKHSRTSTRWLFGGLLVAVSACADVLNVPNENAPETDRVLATPADVEALIRNSYEQAIDPLLQSDGINMQLGSVAFENSAMAANFGMIERSAFPRTAIINTIADQFAGDYYEVWRESYTAIRSASDGLDRMGRSGFTLGSAASDARARAFANLVLGIAHGTLAITYDKASIYDETVPAAEVRPLVAYGEVMTAALGYFDRAIGIAQQNTSISFPADWFGTAVNAAQFIRIANSFKARYRAQVARNPAERQAVDWNKLIAEVDAGITSDYAAVDDDTRFDFWMHDYMSFQGAWHQVNYFVAGMADTSGAYQAWMALPVGSRNPITISTPDKRFPQGSTLAAQRTAPGKYVHAKASGGEGAWIRAERGTWRWSEYKDERFRAYYNANLTGVPMPIITRVEMDLLKAEGLIRTNLADQALPLINATRVGNGGLPPATLAGAPGGNACVPKLPNGQCGDLLETLKWEKRMEIFMTVFGGWYFDSRGWGDLAEGTFIHYPVPARELEVRQEPAYTYGGVGQPGGAPKGTYGY